MLMKRQQQKVPWERPCRIQFDADISHPYVCVCALGWICGN